MRNKIRAERNARGWTQEELGKKVSVSRQTINAMEGENYVPSAVLAMKICRVFGKTVEELFSLEKGE